MTGINYRNLTESEFNDGLNDYIRNYLKSDKTQLKKIVSNMVSEYKKIYLTGIHPLEILEKLKKFLKTIQNKMNQRGIFDFFNFNFNLDVSIHF